jgi:hypothetical protein
VEETLGDLGRRGQGSKDPDTFFVTFCSVISNYQHQIKAPSIFIELE